MLASKDNRHKSSRPISDRLFIYRGTVQAIWFSLPAKDERLASQASRPERCAIKPAQAPLPGCPSMEARMSLLRLALGFVSICQLLRAAP